MTNQRTRRLFQLTMLLGLLLSACLAPAATPAAEAPTASPTPTEAASTVTPMPTRPAYDPGQLVQYIAQNGDNLIALATRFNTSVEEILRANPVIPVGTSTLPAGLPMEIPIYYRAYWGSAFQIIPDSHFVNGPGVLDFNTQVFVDSQPGWFKNYQEYTAGQNRSGAGVVDLVATNFSVSPRLLLALLEYQAGALSQPALDPGKSTYPLGYENRFHKGVYLQLVWAANQLNNGYYAWRAGKLFEFERQDGRIYRPDPWQNAASVSLQLFFNGILPEDRFDHAIGPEGFAQTYSHLFGDPWQNDIPHLPGSLVQPELRLPFEPGQVWAFTGGPHTGWGQGEPWAAMDFAPGLRIRGCISTDAWAIALADGVVVRSEVGVVVLDLDGDGDERTGWVIFYLHLAKKDRARVGQHLLAGWPVGHPSCEGGSSTGTHVHVARKYNGEWIEAGGALPFVMEGWTPSEGGAPYLGTLVRLGHTIIACTCSDASSGIASQAEVVAFPTPDLQLTETATPVN